MPHTDRGLATGYTELMKRRMFAPVGMRSTPLDFDAASQNPSHALPHAFAPTVAEVRRFPVALERFAVPVAPAGAVWSNAADMARFAITEMAGVTPDGRQVVSAQNLRATRPGGWNRTLGNILVALCLAGCAASSAQSAAPLSARAPIEPRAAQPPASGSVDDAIRLAVFRYMLNHNASGGQAGVPFVCLEVHQGDQTRDPSPFIMEAMRGSRPRAVPGSACEASDRGVVLKRDSARGRGLVFRTEKVEIDGDKATVTGGYYEGSLSASGNVYTVERQGDGSWLVTDDRMEWIS